jgi:hypothetical protein
MFLDLLKAQELVLIKENLDHLRLSGILFMSPIAHQSYSVSVLLLPEAVRIPEAATLLSFSQLSVETVLSLAVASLLSVSLLSPETAGASAAAKAVPHIWMTFWQRWEATTAD